MILAIDIGNTNLVIGGIEGEQLCFTLRIRSDRLKTVDEYMLTVKGLLDLHGVTVNQLEGGIIASVVPELRTVLTNAMERLTGKRFLVVGAGLKTGLNIKMDTPSQLGADLVRAIRKKSLRSFSFPFCGCCAGFFMGRCPIPRRLLKKAGENVMFDF